jgi:hypothetical protein
MHHLKINVKKNQKRGLPSLYAPDEDLRGTQTLRYASREGTKVRSSIPYVREYEQADLSAVQALQNQEVTDDVIRYSNLQGERTVEVKQLEPGAVHDIPMGLKYNSPPADPNTDAVDRSIHQGLQAVAANFNAPEWLVSGASSESSYAASLTSENPFLRCVLDEQSVQVEFWHDLFRSILEIEVEKGTLEPAAMDEERIQVIVLAPSAHSRNKVDEVNINSVLRQQGVLSLQTWTAESGYDFDVEQERIKEEMEMGIQPPPPETPSQNQTPLGGQQATPMPSPVRPQPQTASGARRRDEGGNPLNQDASSIGR